MLNFSSLALCLCTTLVSCLTLFEQSLLSGFFSAAILYASRAFSQQQRQQLLALCRLSWCQDPPKAKRTSPLTSTRVSRPTKTRNAPQPCQRGRRAFTTSVAPFPLAIPRSSPSLRPGASIDRSIDRSPPIEGVGSQRQDRYSTPNTAVAFPRNSSAILQQFCHG